MNEYDWLVVIISNQKSIAEGRGTLEEAEARLAEITDELRRSGAVVDASYICPHCDTDECGCRKPKVGLYARARDELGIDISKSWVVGDLWRDVVAGHALGARTAQVLTSHRAHTRAPSEYAGLEPDLVARDVLEAVTAIFARER